jgi:putative toxin-antitoxin system antitoxin component (TIGR02293 family)
MRHLAEGSVAIATTTTRATRFPRPNRRAATSPATTGSVRDAAQRITVDRVRAGLEVAEVEALLRNGILRTEEVRKVVPPRTLARRKSRQMRLSVEESDRIARLVRIAAHVARVFDDPELLSAWLRTGNPALGGERPIDLAITDIGARRVETVLNRIEWGDYS